MGGAVVLDTTFSVIMNEQQTATQTVINGQVDVRNLTIDAGATLLVRGPNPLRITASGTVRINGTIDAGTGESGGAGVITGGETHAGGPARGAASTIPAAAAGVWGGRGSGGAGRGGWRGRGTTPPRPRW